MFPNRTGVVRCSEWDEKRIELNDLAKSGFGKGCHPSFETLMGRKCPF